ncbi:site-specific integrase [Aliarcobacter cryaerophilus]|uniref:site-specific integrase n=1 Tax=Aliarcobacter cryaerophilus TaxID=28198 RepID=UPI0021B5070B|nr:site-specific integrase [Aliarcobacter cryaerophilus]MCT7535959.1 site-specific integrase [Aliarcobacter cryaerophilus]
MDIETITIPHPNIRNRDITLLLVDNNIDEPSMRFLIHEARYGGRNNSLLGKSSHKIIAFQIAELYKHLDSMGLKWDKAIETDIKKIRNAMLCWDANDNKDYENFPYKKIENDTMNIKLNTWFKFYKYMDKIKISNDMIITTKKVKKIKPDNMLRHLNTRYDTNQNTDYIDSWILKVKASPKYSVFHALSRTEFSKLRQHLNNLDIVYEIIAIFMVETGLRVDAALNAPESDFKDLFKLIGSGKSLNDIVYRTYTAKGGDTKKYELPLRTIDEIHSSYITRIYPDRKYYYEKRCERLDIKIDDNVLWISKRGKKIEANDVWNAFRKVSEKMGRKDNKITPHWLRHTFATWTIIDISNFKNISLENTGILPNPLLISALQQKLGHASINSTLKYIATALRLMSMNTNDGIIKMSLRSFKQNLKSQELVTKEAKIEFGNEFDENIFDVFQYAISRGIVIDDELVKDSKYK